MQLVFMGKPVVGMFNISQCAVCKSSVSIAYPRVSIAYPIALLLTLVCLLLTQFLRYATSVLRYAIRLQENLTCASTPLWVNQSSVCLK